MPHPYYPSSTAPTMRLTDDLSTVTLDLHGARIDAAVRAARKAASICAARGRHRLDLVHGASTTTPADAQRPTIKRALHAWADGGGPHGVTATMRGDSTLTLVFDLTARRDPRRLTLRDIAG